MGAADLTSTTLSAALNATDRIFLVASTTGILAGDKIVVEDEMMHVIAVPVAGTLEVQRGTNGSAPSAHAIGTAVYQGDEDEFGPQAKYEGKYQTRAGTPPSGLPKYPVALGTVKRDALGNEYVFCSYANLVYAQLPVTISEVYDAAVLGTTGRGRVGVVAEEGSSDQGGWVQVYGRCLMQIGSSGVSPSDAANGPTTLSTSVATRFYLTPSQSTPIGMGWVSDQGSTSDAVSRYYVNGISVATDASMGDVSLVTSAASHTGIRVAVFLNYPYIIYDERHGSSV